jgi:hypothetical protein
MTLETAIGYLVAFAVPLWLLIEAALIDRRSRTQSEHKAESGRASSRPSAPGGAPSIARPSALPRRAA